MTIADKATRLTARVAPYRDAITEARKAGLTWGDIATVLGVKTPDRLRWAVLHSQKYEAAQIPLPTPEPQIKPDRGKASPPAARSASSMEADGQSDIERIVNKNLIK